MNLTLGTEPLTLQPPPAVFLQPAAYLLPAIPYLRLRCTLRSTGEAELPEHKGSLLRGAFGHALRSAVCSFGLRATCADCRLRQACLYTRIFETFIEGESPVFLHGISTSPRPYVFEPVTAARRFAPGDRLDFDLVLFGQAAALSAYALFALERMAADGLGRDRFPFTLDQVRVPGDDGGWHDLVRAGRPVPGAFAAPRLPATTLPDPSRLVLRFLTPTRLKADAPILPAPNFRALVFAMLRRTLETAHFHVPGATVDWTFRPLLERSAGVRVVAERLIPQGFQRYSNRQRARMTLSGFTGEIELEGDLAPFAALLRTAEILHVGKHTTFGLGRLEIAREPLTKILAPASQGPGTN